MDQPLTMDQQDHAGLDHYRILSHRLNAMVEQFYMFSNDMDVQIANTLAMSDNTGLNGTILTEGLNTVTS